ncbi:AraC family transcriptional regulator [Niastella koreensis]|uniref:Transcriptional regulator, AraC family n=2 Tax=Niastella koreensis TaxID=354356 RepID=G8TJ80_NIAKG|nr:helix-turn-helix domain-containing protein [Niastella koreensis]AEV98613.1 transcriptional regulator, AraC family [Niastella koreensis GR20-10]OQP52948.1 AraC family transcriptional regulator [Niastella koreensis]
MINGTPARVKTITQAHRVLALPTPKHPLISVVDYTQVQAPAGVSAVFDFYSISLKRGVNKLIYGQQEYDFDEGVLYFLAPNQVLSAEETSDKERSGWILFLHPDFLWNTSLAKKIKQYEFFNYSVNEALFLSENEETILNGIIQNIQQEYNANIDKFSQDVIIAQLELLLTYSRRFYERQFITRKITNHKILERLEDLLNDYFNSEDILSKGLPSVQYVAEKLTISTKYLSNLLKQLTGQTTQQHIQNKLIEKAKEKLSTTDLSVSEIAYQLGFEHSQSFNKLFKTKTNLSPLEFRRSFN